MTKPDYYPSLEVGGLTNKRRVAFALKTVQKYRELTRGGGEPLATLIRDLLSDLLHLLDATGEKDSEGEITHALDLAVGHWQEERALSNHEGRKTPEQATKPLEFL